MRVQVHAHSLDTEANRFYDVYHRMYESALLTRPYTQHVPLPLINFETYQSRHFNTSFINNGIDLIDIYGYMVYLRIGL